MPAKSKKQRKMMGIALGVKRGKTPKGYSPQAAKMAKGMTEKQLEDFARKPKRKKGKKSKKF